MNHALTVLEMCGWSPLLPLATAALMLFAGRRMAARAIGCDLLRERGRGVFVSLGVFAELIAMPVSERLVVRRRC